MGNARWDPGQYQGYTDSIRHSSRGQIFSQRGINKDLDPKTIKVRESVDSPANPQAHPIMIGVDETGSMGVLAEIIIRTGLGKIMKQIYDHQPVPDPQILCMGLGDAYVDSAPLQMTQFEASVDPLTKQVEQIFLEGNGGGNGGESYALAWWAAINKTTCDAITKRHKKGYLFTIGDECCHSVITAQQIQQFGGVGAEKDISTDQLLAQAQKWWNVFHLIVKPVPDQPVVRSWERLLKERAIMVEDQEKLPETIVAIIRLVEGQTNVTDDYDDSTAQVVSSATRKLLPAAAGR